MTWAYNLVKIVAALILACFVAVPAYSISVSMSADGVSLSEDLILDTSTEFSGNTELFDGSIMHDSQATGTGYNKIEEGVGGANYGISNTVESKGSITTTASAAASADSGVFGHSTEMSGDAGQITTAISTPENSILIAGGYEGTGGSMQADMVSAAGERAGVAGSASISGINVLDGTALEGVSSGDVAMSVDGLYLQSDASKSSGLGSFGMFAISKENTKTSGAQKFLQPAYAPDSGDQNAYKTAGWRWNTQNPQIGMYLRDDANLRNRGLDPTATSGAITSAAQTWESATSQNLFADVNTITVSTTKSADKYDGVNVAAFLPFTGTAASALAYSRTYYSYTKVGGYYSAKESDLSFNALYQWDTTGSGLKYDVQSVALHELGHTLGLGDLYNDPKFSGDTREVMNAYTGVKRELGNGDKTGIWTLYG